MINSAKFWIVNSIESSGIKPIFGFWFVISFARRAVSELLAYDDVGSLFAPVADPKAPLYHKGEERRKKEREKDRRKQQRKVKEEEQYGIGLKALFPYPDPIWWLVRTPFF